MVSCKRLGFVIQMSADPTWLLRRRERYEIHWLAVTLARQVKWAAVFRRSLCSAFKFR